MSATTEKKAAEPQGKPGVPAVHEPTDAERFAAGVFREFGALAGEPIELTPQQRVLAQHLFLKIDADLKAAEAKRLALAEDGNKYEADRAPFVWGNIHLGKLAVDAVHRVNLGLDALCPNFIHPIPYWHKREKKYVLDLRVGYAGKDFYRRQVAIEKPLDIIYELVYSTDRFHPIKKDLKHEIESYDFEITNSFDRGDIVGGFGYIMYKEPRKNRLVLVTPKDFERSLKASQGRAKEVPVFWRDNPTEMRWKTVVHRTLDKLQIDPAKVNASWAVVEEQERQAEAEVIEGEIVENANKIPLEFGPVEKPLTPRDKGDTVHNPVPPREGGMSPNPPKIEDKKQVPKAPEPAPPKEKPETETELWARWDAFLACLPFSDETLKPLLQKLTGKIQRKDCGPLHRKRISEFMKNPRAIDEIARLLQAEPEVEWKEVAKEYPF